MRILRLLIVFFALAPATWMTFDGSRALIVGDYFTPASGELGPWSAVVTAIGIPPRSTLMKAVFVVCGACWLVAAVGFIIGTPWSNAALATVSAGTLWYLPVGTLVSMLILLALWIIRVRTRRGRRSA